MKLFDQKWKWVLLILIVITGGFLLYRYFFYTCCALPPELKPDNLSSDSILKDPDLFYAKRAFIGLCRTKSEYGGSCRYNTYLYFSGKLVEESGELTMEPDGEKTITYPTIQKELDKNLMDKIIKQVRDSGIMTKTCEAEMILDLFIDYHINLDGLKKEIKFPGCESELKEIDALIDATTDK